MTPYFPAGDPIGQLKRLEANARQFAEFAAEFLACAFPHVPRQVVDAARLAWVDWMCTGTEEQIKGLEEQAEFRRAHPIPSHLYPMPKSAEEQLMDLVEVRDKKQHIIESMKTAFEKMRGTSFPEELIPVMELQLQPFVDELERTEKLISDLQRSIEERAQAQSPEDNRIVITDPTSGAD